MDITNSKIQKQKYSRDALHTTNLDLKMFMLQLGILTPAAQVEVPYKLILLEKWHPLKGAPSSPNL